MKKNKTIIIQISILLSLTILTSCAISVAPVRNPLWHTEANYQTSREFTVLGPVRVEKTWVGFVGMTLPGINTRSPFLVQYGGILYDDVLAEARRRYQPQGAVSVIDISYDFQDHHILFLLFWRTEIVHGTAIRYNR